MEQLFYFLGRKTIGRVIIYYYLFIKNSNKISACLCYNDEAADTSPLEYLFLLLLFLFSAVLGLVIQISPNRNFSFTIPGSLCKTKAACTGRQLHPDGQRFPLGEFIQWVGFLFYFKVILRW